MIYRRLDKAIQKNKVASAIDIICQKLSDQIISDQIVSVRNFGTFSMYLFHGHAGYDPNTGLISKKEPFYMVRFHPHAAFLRLLSNKRSKFSKSTKLG